MDTLKALFYLAVLYVLLMTVLKITDSNEEKFTKKIMYGINKEINEIALFIMKIIRFIFESSDDRKKRESEECLDYCLQVLSRDEPNSCTPEEQFKANAHLRKAIEKLGMSEQEWLDKAYDVWSKARILSIFGYSYYKKNRMHFDLQEESLKMWYEDFEFLRKALAYRNISKEEWIANGNNIGKLLNS